LLGEDLVGSGELPSRTFTVASFCRDAREPDEAERPAVRVLVVFYEAKAVAEKLLGAVDAAVVDLDPREVRALERDPALFAELPPPRLKASIPSR
jgi:hypothetical protein